MLKSAKQDRRAPGEPIKATVKRPMEINGAEAKKVKEKRREVTRIGIQSPRNEFIWLREPRHQLTATDEVASYGIGGKQVGELNWKLEFLIKAGANAINGFNLLPKV